MQYYIPDTIFTDTDYLGHTFSRLEAIIDLQFLKQQEIELSVRKLALRWRWKRTKTDEFIRDWRTKSGQFADTKTDTSVYKNQGVTQDLRTPKRTKSGQKADNLSVSKEKETLSPNNIIITPIKEKEKDEKENLIVENKFSTTKEKAHQTPEEAETPTSPPSPPKMTKKELETQKKAAGYARQVAAGKNIPPTIGQINDYLAKRGFTDVDAELFWNFYDSKGWKVGKEKMVNWHSAIATWRKQRQNNNSYANNRTTGRYNGQQFASAQEREDYLASRLLRKYQDILDDQMADK